jgi:hypothetical protein
LTLNTPVRKTRAKNLQFCFLAHTHTHRKYNNRQSTAQKINSFISMLH